MRRRFGVRWRLYWWGGWKVGYRGTFPIGYPELYRSWNIGPFELRRIAERLNTDDWEAA